MYLSHEYFTWETYWRADPIDSMKEGFRELDKNLILSFDWQSFVIDIMVIIAISFRYYFL